ncbi:MAG: TlpA family protein disulfide reductase [Phycisphaerae bacterium]|jgi:thiol-disulfide isomerase/thioredoxin|nr:TlpA family protein disulfide reductase [Phycisphaerae bacterium]
MPIKRACIGTTAALVATFVLSLDAATAQDAAPASAEIRSEPNLRAGQPAPPLAVEAFLKGAPITEWAHGHIYVLEFWATWCGPCVAAMPHLSELQAEFRDKDVHIVGINIWEDPTYSADTAKKVREFVAKKDALMGYAIAFDGAAKATDRAWMGAAGRKGIPTTFVVDRAGLVAWIGHPSELDPVLAQVVDGSWDPLEGPKRLKAARDATIAACGKYAESFEAGEQAWEAATKPFPHLAAAFEDRRYAEMLAAGHVEQATRLGRAMFEKAKAKRDSIALMDIVVPMLDPQMSIKTFDRTLVKDVANAIAEVGDMNDPGPHICLVQINLLLGNRDAAAEHTAKALALAPADRKEAMERWLKELAAAAAEKPSAPPSKN